MSFTKQNTAPKRPAAASPASAPKATTTTTTTSAPAPTATVAPAKPKPALTEKQIAWSQAFMRAMGMGGSIDAKVVPETAASKLKGGLSQTDNRLDSQTGANLARSTGVKGSGEKVGRGLLQRAGKGYKADVVEKVNAVLKRASGLAAEGTVGTSIQALITELTAARDGYEERETGETDKAKLDQRQRKVAAIDGRIEALRGLLDDAERTKVIALTHMNDEQKTAALVQNPAILGALFRKDPTDVRIMAALQKLAVDNPAGFSAEPGMFAAYLKSKTPVPKEIVGILAAAEGSGADAMSEQVMASFGGNARLMNALCKGIVESETGEQTSTGTFFRGNSAATKLTKSFAQSGAESKTFQDGLTTVRNTVFAQTPAQLEIDRYKIDQENTGKEDDQKIDPDDLIDKSVAFIKQSCDTILASLYAMNVPANVATTAAMIAAAARSKKLKPDEVVVMIGGHLLLRLINPLLTTAKKPGDAALAGNEQRLINLVTKVMQNISNHVVATKEPYMEGLTAYTKSKMPEMDRWCLAVADRGAALLAGRS